MGKFNNSIIWQRRFNFTWSLRSSGSSWAADSRDAPPILDSITVDRYKPRIQLLLVHVLWWNDWKKILRFKVYYDVIIVQHLAFDSVGPYGFSFIEYAVLLLCMYSSSIVFCCSPHHFECFFTVLLLDCWYLYCHQVIYAVTEKSGSDSWDTVNSLLVIQLFVDQVCLSN